MTAADFIAARVVFFLDVGTLCVQGPAGRTDLLEQLRAEVERRIPIWSGEIPARLAGNELCACGDDVDSDICELCVLARQKVAEAKAAAPALAPGERPTKRRRAADTSRLDPWSFVIAECPEGRTRQGHADYQHLAEDGAAVLCVPRRVLTAGEQHTAAWSRAVARSYPYSVPDPSGATGRAVRWWYPPPVPFSQPATMAFQQDEGRTIDRQHEANAPGLAAYYADLRRRGVIPVHVGAAPGPSVSRAAPRRPRPVRTAAGGAL